MIHPHWLITPATLRLSNIDLAVLAGYFVLIIITGLILARKKQHDTQDYFLAARKMPAWAVALSVLATSLSAATFIGAPQQAYTSNLTYLIANIGGIIAALVIAAFFIPAFFNANVTSIYELISQRLSPIAGKACSIAFMLGRILASGARIYIAALPASMIAFGDIEPNHLFIAIAILATLGTLYTLTGGISSVIWTDAIQTAVFLIAAGAAIVVLLNQIPLSTSQIIHTLANETPSKLTLVDLSTNPTSTYTLWAAIIGFTLLNIASYGVDQDLSQRLLTCKTSKRASLSIISAIALSIPVVSLFMIIGLLLHIFYQQPDITPPDDSRKVFLAYILNNMPTGLKGLMMAGLFAAGLSSLNSAINAMASTFISDFYRPKTKNDARDLLVSRIAVVVWGIILALFACLCVLWQKNSNQTLIDFALSIMTFAYAGLLAVFFCALFTNRGSTFSAITALLVGFITILAQQPILYTTIAPTFALHPSPNLIDTLTAHAFPWKLTIATVLATITCLTGTRNKSQIAEPNSDIQ